MHDERQVVLQKTETAEVELTQQGEKFRQLIIKRGTILYIQVVINSKLTETNFQNILVWNAKLSRQSLLHST